MMVRAYRLVFIMLLAALAVGVWAARGRAAESDRMRARYGDMTVEAAVFDYKVKRPGTLLVFTGDVRATRPGMELQHAEKATAELGAGGKWSTITATGGVRFWMKKEAAGQAQKASGRCEKAILHNTEGRKLAGDQRLLVADLSGKVYLELTGMGVAGLPGGAAPQPGAAAAPPEPLIIEAARARVWQTAEGLEYTVGKGID
ncbi:MAG: hypothetical protein HY321_05070 [Armatimonadetes bacterium]|nr:hypothetical protein [Armatimonadota bacterium]